jgi:hypothetical protein
MASKPREISEDRQKDPCGTKSPKSPDGKTRWRLRLERIRVKQSRLKLLSQHFHVRCSSFNPSPVLKTPWSLKVGRQVVIQLPALAEMLVTLDLPMEIARSSLRSDRHYSGSTSRTPLLTAWLVPERHKDLHKHRDWSLELGCWKRMGNLRIEVCGHHELLSSELLTSLLI